MSTPIRDVPHADPSPARSFGGIMPSAPESMYLIDAHSLIFQVFHAIRDMTTSGGLPANALFGFLRDVLSLRARKPAYLIVAFDVTGPTFRDTLYPAYKANRGPMPDDLQPQIPLIYQALEALRVPVLGVPGYEADDVLATVGRAAAAKGIDVFLCTSDKDCRQLLSDRIKMYNLRKGQVFGPEQLREDWGVTPEQVVDLQTLVGDSVDNVPGVFGVGVKTAAKLLQEYGTLDNLLGNLDKVKGKLKENLTAAVPKLPLSRKLVRLDTSVPIEMDWDGWRLKEWDGPKLLALFEAWGFRSMAREVRESLPASERATRNGEGTPPAAVTQRDLFDAEELFPFGANANPEEGDPSMPRAKAKKWVATYELIATPKKFEGFLKKLSKQKRIAFDLETTSLDPLRCDIVGFAFSWNEGEGYYLPVRGPEGEKVLDEEATLKALKPIFEDEAVAKVNQNVKYDLLVLRAHGVNVAGVAGDSMVADYLLHSGERSHGLDELSRRYLNHEVIPITDLIGKNKKSQITMDQVPTEKVAEYAGEDADVAWRLCALLEPQLDTEGLGSLYRDVEVPLIEVLAELEYNGIRLDVPLLKRLGGEMGAQLEAIEKEIHELAGHAFNIASLPQLRKVLFEELKLPVQRKTGLTNVPSTDHETLEKLATLTHLPGHRLPKKILEHRQISKLKGTYVDALPLLINPKTGRLHTSFNQTVASTGRLSCLPAGTRVNTGRGLVGIESVRAGDVIRTAFGPRRVLDWQPTGNKPVLVLRFSNNVTLRCSPDHRLRSAGRWVHGADLRPGDPVYMSCTAGLFGKDTRLELSHASAYRTRKSPRLPSRWTPRLAELTGYVMADGHLPPSAYNGKADRVVLAFDWDDDELIEYFAAVVEDIFGKKPVRRLTKSCPVLEVYSVDVANAFVQLGAGGKSGVIRVPPSLFTAPESIVAGFLRGYFEGDGCVGLGAGVQVRSVSWEMLEDVQQLLTLFGIAASITRGYPDPRGYAPRHKLVVCGDRSKQVFEDRIGFLSSEKRCRCRSYVALPRDRTADELLTLPRDYDVLRWKPRMYEADRRANGKVSQALYVFACKLARGNPTVTIRRAESMVATAPPVERAWPSDDFLSEAVAGAYHEVHLVEVREELSVPMYDIAVEEVEQYIANGIVVHNSVAPNLQNIPVRREQGQQIRQAFLPEQGWKLLCADYSQIELRLLAHFTGDETMRDAFAEDRDIHAAVATQIFGVEEDKVTPEMRRMAKTVNFGVIYGISPLGLGVRLGMKQEEAAKFIANYFAKYPKVLEYQTRLLQECHRTQRVGTILGRRRRIEGVRPDSTFQQRNQPEREAINMEVQGSAADLIKLAMLRVHRRLKEEQYRARMLLQIHDELVFETPPKELAEVAALVREEMTTPLQEQLGLEVPLKVDLSAGPNWLDVKEIEADS